MCMVSIVLYWYRVSIVLYWYNWSSQPRTRCQCITGLVVGEMLTVPVSICNWWVSFSHNRSQLQNISINNNQHTSESSLVKSVEQYFQLYPVVVFYNSTMMRQRLNLTHRAIAFHIEHPSTAATTPTQRQQQQQQQQHQQNMLSLSISSQTLVFKYWLKTGFERICL